MKTAIRQRVSTIRKENLLAVFFALVLSAVVYTVGQNTGLLTADVVGGPQIEFNAYSDIVVVPRTEDTLHIFAGKNMDDLATLSMILLFDPDRVQIDTDVFSSEMNYSYAPAGKGKGTLVLTNTKNASFKVKDRLVEIQAPGSFHDLVVADVVARFTNGDQESLSVEMPK